MGGTHSDKKPYNSGEAVAISLSRAENQQGDDIGATHRKCGLQIVNRGLKNADIGGRIDISPQSEIANPQFFLPPLAICRGHLT